MGLVDGAVIAIAERIGAEAATLDVRHFGAVDIRAPEVASPRGEWLVGLEVDRELLHSESLPLSSLDRRVLAQLPVRLTDVHSRHLFAKAFYPPLALAATTVALCLAGEHLHGQWLLAVPILALYWLRSLVISVRRTALGFEWSLVQSASGSRFAGQEAELEADASADAFERLTDEARELVEGIPSPHPAVRDRPASSSITFGNATGNCWPARALFAKSVTGRLRISRRRSSASQKSCRGRGEPT